MAASHQTRRRRDGTSIGVITAMSHVDGAPPYLVRWLDDGRITLIFPEPEARLEPPVVRAA